MSVNEFDPEHVTDRQEAGQQSAAESPADD
ncbi:MAG: hypothetical protein J07HN4v3_00113 [Halonotius sp. J07HN4]|nr:MAG: hypothetical protein J07HN4v3_00113 [Halonotius sp. J07HN4]